MYIIWHVFVSYMSADSFRGVTGIWICGVNQMPWLGPRFRFSPSCLFLVKVVTKMGLVILLWQAQKKQTTLQNTETSLGQNSPLTEAVDSPQCGLGSISAMIEPWIEKPRTESPPFLSSFKRLHSSTILPDRSVLEPAPLQSPVPAFPHSAWRETDTPRLSVFAFRLGVQNLPFQC